MKHLFTKGNKLGKAGRPAGSKDRKYLSLGYWYAELQKDWKKLKPEQRARLSVDAMKMLVSKMKDIPNSPSDSLRNAEEMNQILNDLEGKARDERSNVVVSESIETPNSVGPKDPYIGPSTQGPKTQI